MKLNKYDREAIVRAIMNDVPKPDKAKRRAAIQAAVVKLMTPECRKVFTRTPEALAEFYAGDLTNTDYYATKNIVIGDAPKDQVRAILQPYKDEDAARFDAQTKLSSAVHACSTLKQLTDRLPEFTKYFPVESTPAKNLPALANVVADLSKLGWPKGQA